MVNSKYQTYPKKNKYLLCLHGKLEIVNFEDQDHLSNKRSELISKGRDANKYLLRNYKAND